MRVCAGTGCQVDISTRHGLAKYCVMCAPKVYVAKKADAEKRRSLRTADLPQRLCFRCRARNSESRRHKYCRACCALAKLETQTAIRRGLPPPDYATQAQHKHLEPAWLVERLLAAAAMRRKRTGRMTLSPDECWRGGGVADYYDDGAAGPEA